MSIKNDVGVDFIKKMEPHILHEDAIIQENLLYMVEEFPFLPVSWTNRLLEKALMTTEKRSDILLRLKNFPTNEDSVQLIIRLAEVIPNQQKHWLIEIVNNLSPELILTFDKELLSHGLITKQDINLCQILTNGDEEEIWEEYGSTLVKLDSEHEYQRDLFRDAKKLVKKLVELGSFDERETVVLIEEDLDKEWFSFKGILAVYAAGLLKINHLIPTLAQLLDRDDDVLLEEASTALKEFQTKEVVEAVYPYAKSNKYYLYALAVLKDTKIESSIDVMRKSYNYLDQDGKAMCIECICSHLTEKAVPLIQDYIERNYQTRLIDMEEIYYSYYKLMGIFHPKLEAWKQLSILKAERANQIATDVFKKYPALTTSENEQTTTKKVGRNDPCPCGSGKKYKKCCGA